MINDTSIHRQAWDQIPWIVNGSLPEAEGLAVQAHLQTCADCREELEFQRRLAASMTGRSSLDIDPQASWVQLRQRLEAAGTAQRAERHGLNRTRGTSGRWVPWLVAAMVVQAIGLGVLGTMLWSRQNASTASSAGVYRTLSASEVASGSATIRAVFASDMTVAKMQALLAAAGLQVQSGPSNAGVWSLEPARTSDRSATTFALGQLRDSPDVRFAEAIGGPP